MLSRWIQRIRVALPLIVCLSIADVTSAQVAAPMPDGTGTINGVAIDETGAAVPDVRIMVTNDATALRREATTGVEGTFTLPLLPAGQYTLRAERSGFAAHEVTGVIVKANEAATVRVQLKVDSINEGVVVTAQKRGEERVLDVPVPVSVLDARQLADTNKTHVRDFFDMVPGFNGAPGSFDRAELSIRGVSPLGGAPTVGVVIDDIPFGLSGGSQTGVIPEIDPGDLARIEVLRGPQGSLYGAGSMGGLVKYVTADPTSDKLSGHVEAGTNDVHNGSAPGLNLRGAFNVPVDQTFALRASGFVRQDAGYIDNPVRRVDGINESRMFGGRVSALWRPARNTSLNVGAIYQDFKRNGLDEETIAAAGYPQTDGLGSLQQNYVSGTGDNHIRIQHYSAIFKTDLGAVDLTSLTGFNKINMSWSVDLGHLFDPATVDAMFPGQGAISLPYFEVEHQQKFSEELRLHAALGHAADVVVGGFYTHESSPASFFVPADNANGRSVGVFWTYDQPSSTLREYAFFGNLTLTLTKKLSLQLGARQSYFGQNLGETTQTGALFGTTPDIGAALSGDEHAFTYLVTPQYKLTDHAMLYARFASGYRPSQPNIVLPGVPRESKPDETKNYEVGFKTAIPSRRLTLDTSVYHIDWKDIQLNFRDPDTQFVYIGNAGEGASDGVELASSLDATNNLTFRGTFSFDNARLTEGFPANSQYVGRVGDRLPMTSKVSGALSVEQRFPVSVGFGFASATATYVGDRKGFFVGSVDRQDLPAYARLDLQTGLQRTDWTLTIYANNVTDTRGMLNGGIGYFFPPARLYITPRTIGLTVSKSF